MRQGDVMERFTSGYRIGELELVARQSYRNGLERWTARLDDRLFYVVILSAEKARRLLPYARALAARPMNELDAHMLPFESAFLEDSGMVIFEKPAGMPLSAWATRPIARSTAMLAAFELLRAMQRLHAEGLAHGQLDADAVFITEEGHVTVGFVGLGNVSRELGHWREALAADVTALAERIMQLLAQGGEVSREMTTRVCAAVEGAVTDEHPSVGRLAAAITPLADEQTYALAREVMSGPAPAEKPRVFREETPTVPDLPSVRTPVAES